MASPHGSAANFRRIADILHWLCDRLGPGATLAGGVRTEAERVVLVRSAAEFFVTRAGLRLNPRRLYASSSATAGELLKVTQLLIRAPQKLKRGSGKDANGSSGAGKYANGHDDDNDDDERSGDEYAGTFGGITNIVDLSDRIDDLRRARELSGQLTQSGATLYDQLGKEVQNRERRNGQATRPLELAAVERSLKTSVAQMTQRMETARQQLETARGERNALQTKVDRKAGELERMRQRLGALQKIRYEITTSLCWFDVPNKHLLTVPHISRSSNVSKSICRRCSYSTRCVFAVWTRCEPRWQRTGRGRHMRPGRRIGR